MTSIAQRIPQVQEVSVEPDLERPDPPAGSVECPVFGQVPWLERAAPGDTPISGPHAIHRWAALLDRAEELMRDYDLDDPCAQRTAGRAIDSLFRYEHQLTPETRRAAREFVWRRDRADQPLPDATARREWERCRCRACLVERVLHRPSVVPPTAIAA